MPMRLLRAALAVILWAVAVDCGGRGLMPGEATPGHWQNGDGAQEQRVAYTDQVDTWEEWTNTPWWQPSDDMIRPNWKIAVSDEGFACVMSDDLWTIIPSGAMLACKWRFPRPTVR